MKPVQFSKAKARTLSVTQINADVLIALFCIGAGLMVPFVTLANLLITRYH